MASSFLVHGAFRIPIGFGSPAFAVLQSRLLPITFPLYLHILPVGAAVLDALVIQKIMGHRRNSTQWGQVRDQQAACLAQEQLHRGSLSHAAASVVTVTLAPCTCVQVTALQETFDNHH